MTVIINNAQVRNLNIGPTIPTEGLISYWNAASPYSYPRTGSVWYDLVRNNDGSMVNMTSGNFSEDIQGHFVLDGTDDYISVPTNESLDPASGAFTITAWVNPDVSAMSAGVPYLLINKRGAGPQGFYAGWEINVAKDVASNKWGFVETGLDDGTGVATRGNGSTIHDPSWTHVAATYTADRTSFYVNEFITYVNSNADLSLTVPTGINSLSNTIPLDPGNTLLKEYGPPVM